MASRPTTRMLPPVKVYLDTDGVLLGADRDKSHRASLADHAIRFLEFAVRNFEVHWLAPQGQDGNAQAVVDHLVRHTPLSERERLMSVAAKVRPTQYEDDRTEALPQDGNFVWFDDELSEGEMAIIKRCGWFDRWQWIDTREEPEDLLRALQWLQGRLGRQAGAGS